MEKKEIHERLNKIFQDVFNDNSIVVDDNTSSNDIEGWDSLMHISLINAIQNEFNVKFSMAETISAINVESLILLISERLNEK